jgi:hypothetical protein
MDVAASVAGYLVVIRRLGHRPRGLEGVAIGVAVGAVALLPVTVGALGRTEHVTTALAVCALGVAGLVVPLGIEVWAVRVLTVRVSPDGHARSGGRRRRRLARARPGAGRRIDHGHRVRHLRGRREIWDRLAAAARPP